MTLAATVRDRFVLLKFQQRGEAVSHQRLLSQVVHRSLELLDSFAKVTVLVGNALKGHVPRPPLTHLPIKRRHPFHGNGNEIGKGLPYLVEKKLRVPREEASTTKATAKTTTLIRFAPEPQNTPGRTRPFIRSCSFTG